MKLKLITLIGTILLLSGCVSSNFNSNKAITPDTLKNKSDLELLKIEEKLEEKSAKNNELYFLDTKDKILYSKSNADIGLDYKINRLLRNALQSAKLPRRRKLNISLEVSNKLKNKEQILSLSQDFILKNRRYALANTDKESLKVLKKVLKEEKDAIYKKNHNIKLRNSSDVILFITGNDKMLSAKVIAKNGAILGKSDISLQKNSNWVEVKVPRNDGPAQIFEVMIKPVTKNDYLGFGGDVAMTNVSFEEANNYCEQKLNAQLIEPYVFEYARRELAILRPIGANEEIIAPYDDEDQDVYYQEGDKLEAPDGTIIMFNWNNEKYYAVSNLYKSPMTTFRCMRAK